MLCQNCGKYEATTHVKRIINGESAEAHLCSDCAKALGYNDVFGGFGNNGYNMRFFIAIFHINHIPFLSLLQDTF